MGGIGATSQSFSMLCDSLMYNKRIKLRAIDISNNPIEDKGFISLGKLLFATQTGFTSLDVSDCGGSKAGCAALFEALDKNTVHANTLTRV
jgi:hypothetical protein